MSRLESYLAHPLAEAVGWALLHSLWQGALVALVFAGGLMFVHRRSPQLRYLLGCAALVLLVVLPVVTGILLYDPGVQPLPGLEPQARIESGSGALTTIVQADGAALSAPAPGVLPAPPVLESLIVRALDLLETGAPWLAGLWLVGVGLLLLRLCGQALYVQRFRARYRTLADTNWQARARALATRLGVRRAWRLVQSDRTESPLTFGVLLPLIMLPTSALTGMPASQLEALLAHELAHVKRHDYLVNLVQCVVEALLFYHPALWWVSGEVRRAREECCDDLAVFTCGDARLYARALTNLEGLRQPALALAATDKPLLMRVRRLLGLKETRHTPPLATGALLLLTVAATVALSFIPLPVAAQNADKADAQPGSLWVSVSSGVAFDDAYTRISKLVIPDKAYVLVEERTATERRTVRVTRGASDTDFVYTYTVDGAARPFDAQAQAWFDAALQAGALGPLKRYAANQAQKPENRGARLSGKLTYDDVSNRHISFVLTASAHLDPGAMLTMETDFRKRNLLSQVAHYAAHDLVADSETGDYLEFFIERSRPAQLETLKPDIMRTVAEMEDEAVKAEVRQALETRINGAASRLEGRVEQATSSREVRPASTVTASPSSQETLNQTSTLKGIVMWNDERLADIKVELQEHIGNADLGPQESPRVLRTTTTDAQGEYVFENVPPGDYMVWAVGDAGGYQTVGYQAAAYAGTSGYDVLRLTKPIEVIGPTLTTPESLTPTLRWKPFPGAARYEVSLDNLSAVEDPLPARRSWRTEAPRLKVEQPLERDKVYGWSVTAYNNDGTRIARTYDPVFSTSLDKARLPVHIESIGVSTVLFEGWKRTSPGVFEYANTKGEGFSLTFERVSGTDPTAAFDSAITRTSPDSQRYGGKEWESFSLEDGSLKLTTVQGDSVYLITVAGGYEPTPLTAEVYSFVLPIVMRNFKVDEQL